MLTPKVLATFWCVLLLQGLCRMKKLIGAVKRAFSSGPSSRGLSSRSIVGSQDSARSSSCMPSPHEIGRWIRYPAHDDVPMAMDNDDISIHSTEEMEKYESLSQWDFGHTHELAREGSNGWRASHHPLDYWLGKTLWRGSDDSNNRWMTLQPCKRKCKHPSTHRPTWCMTSLATSRLTLMLKSCKDLSLGEVPAAYVWVLTCLVSFPAFLVTSSLVLPIGRITTVAMISYKYCFH
jgi:hypothetical protein